MHSKIAFINTGTGRNLGDRAMLRNMVRLVQEAGASEVWVPADMSAQMCAEWGVRPYSLFQHCLGRFQFARWPRLLRAVPIGVTLLVCLALVALRKLRGSDLPWSFMEAELVNTLARTDAVVFNGGGYLTDEGRAECRGCLVTGWLAGLLGNRVYMTGQGIGPFDSGLTRWLLARVARRAEHIAVRDPAESRTLLIGLGVPAERVRALGDDAFTLPARVVPELQERPERLLAVHFRISRFTEGVETIVSTLQQVLLAKQAQGWHIRFFIFSEHEALEREVIGRVTAAGVTRFDVFQSADPRVLKAAVAQADLAIGIAYHFHVFALSCGVPTIGLYGGHYYRQKLEGLFEWFGQTDWVLAFETLDADQVLRLLGDMEQHRADLHASLLERSRRLALAHDAHIAQLLNA